MGPAPSLQTDACFALPEPLRGPFAEELRSANRNLHDVARAARSAPSSRWNVERAIADAWSSLAAIERVVGIEGGVSRAWATHRFLVVDDSPDVRFLVARTLARIAPQATIHTANDALQALALLADAGPGDGLTVISDHDMGPGPTGVELLATVAARHPRAHRVLFTGRPAESFDPQAMPAHALLPKDGADALRRYFGAP